MDIEAALAAPYTRILRRNEHGGFSAEVLEFVGCYATGDDAADAMENLEEAMGLWLEAALDQGQDIPFPLLVDEYSGKLTLRMPPSLHQRAVTQAAIEGISLNRLLAAAVSAYTAETPMSNAQALADSVLNVSRILADGPPALGHVSAPTQLEIAAQLLDHHRRQKRFDDAALDEASAIIGVALSR